MVEVVVVGAMSVFWVVGYIILLLRIYYFIAMFILFYYVES